MKSNKIIQKYFDFLLEKIRKVLDDLRSKGYSWEENETIFTEAPLLNDKFRENLRNSTESLQKRNTIDLELKTLHRIVERRGWKFNPTTLYGIVGAGKKLRAKSSEEHAKEFAQKVVELGAIDALNAHTLIKTWLKSHEFKSWEVLNAAPEHAKPLLKLMEDAFNKMKKDEVLPALELLEKRLPSLKNRCPTLHQEIRGLKAKASARKRFLSDE